MERSETLSTRRQGRTRTRYRYANAGNRRTLREAAEASTDFPQNLKI
ncbi:hypothetical protein [Nostoc sp.]